MNERGHYIFNIKLLIKIQTEKFSTSFRLGSLEVALRLRDWHKFCTKRHKSKES